MEKFGFGKAIDYLKAGRCITREGWNGKGLFVFKNHPSTVTKGSISDLVSMPNSAKSILYDRNIDSINYTNQMIIVNTQGRADSWVPSSSDIFAEDWMLAE